MNNFDCNSCNTNNNMIQDFGCTSCSNNSNAGCSSFVWIIVIVLLFIFFCSNN